MNHVLTTPNGTTLMGAATLQQLEQTSMKTFFEMLPSSFIVNHSKQKGYVDLVNGHRVLFRPLDDPGKARSLNLSCFHIEECSEVSFDYFVQLQTRLRNHATEHHMGILSTNPDMSWVKTEFLLKSANIYNSIESHYIPEEDINSNFSTHIAPTYLNTHLPPNFYEDTAKGKSEWWIARFLDGSFNQTTGQVYPMFSKHIVEPFPIPKNWERVGGADFGIVDPTVLLMGAINPEDGVIYVYDEHYQNVHGVNHHAKVMNEMLEAVPYGALRFLVADPSGGRRSMNDNRTLFDHYAEYGVYFKPGNNRIEAGISKVYTWLMLGKLKVFSTCRNTVREHLNYKYKPMDLDAKKNPDENPIDKDNHSCFIEGTLIETKEGLKPIETIDIGDYVWTRQGYKRVYDSAKTGVNKEVYRVDFSNGSSITATGNHPVWVQNKGFLRLDSLRYSDIIEVSEHWEELQWKESYTKEYHSEDTQTHKTNQMHVTSNGQAQKQNQKRKKCIFIGRYGWIISEKFRKSAISTIKTMIQPITDSKIWKWLTEKNTCPTTENSMNTTQNTSKESDHLQKNGMDQKKVLSGIKRTVRMCGKIEKLVRRIVKVAVNISNTKQFKKLDSAPTNASLHGEEKRESTTSYESASIAEVISKSTSMLRKNTVQVTAVERLQEKHDVYDISVEDAHEYFANGVLVSNCDSLRYIISELPDNPNDLIQKSYNPRDFKNEQKQEHLPHALQDEEEVFSSDWMNY